MITGRFSILLHIPKIVVIFDKGAEMARKSTHVLWTVVFQSRAGIKQQRFTYARVALQMTFLNRGQLTCKAFTKLLNCTESVLQIFLNLLYYNNWVLIKLQMFNIPETVLFIKRQSSPLNFCFKSHDLSLNNQSMFSLSFDLGN